MRRALKTAFMLLTIPFMGVAEHRQPIHIGVGLNYNKHPLSGGFENYVVEIGTSKNEKFEFGLNSRVFYTQNPNRISKIDAFFELDKGKKYFQYQNNIFGRLTPFDFRLNPFLYSELGFQVANSRNRNWYQNNPGRLPRGRESYTKSNFALGAGFNFRTSERFSLIAEVFISNNKTRIEGLEPIAAYYNALFPVKNYNLQVRYYFSNLKAKAERNQQRNSYD